MVDDDTCRLISDFLLLLLLSHKGKKLHSYQLIRRNQIECLFYYLHHDFFNWREQIVHIYVMIDVVIGLLTGAESFNKIGHYAYWQAVWSAFPLQSYIKVNV